MNNTTIIIILVILVFLSAFFSASETAYSSLNKIRLKYLANNGDLKAQKTLELAEDLNTVLSTVLIGNNIVNILSASLATILFVYYFKENGMALKGFQNVDGTLYFFSALNNATKTGWQYYNDDDAIDQYAGIEETEEYY